MVVQLGFLNRAGIGIALVLGILGGCGGGESAIGTTPAAETAPAGDPNFESAEPSSPLPVALTGVVTYDHVPNVGGALRYDLTAVRPVRGAVVEIIETGTERLVASSQTDAQGRYAVAGIQPELGIYVRVKAQLLEPGRWDVRVVDNTQGDALFAMESAAFNAGAGAAEMHAASGWTGAAYAANRAAAPFAILDTVYRAQAKVLEVAAQTVFPNLAVHWSPNNKPASGSVAEGDIGTTHFTRATGAMEIYVLGAENVDTDEYDDSVVAHEWGHYYEAALGQLHSIGGPHRASDALEMTVAFSEGWGDAWSGIVLGRSDYGDSLGAQQAAGAWYEFAPQASANAGWYNERTVSYVLYEFARRQGFGPAHRAMQGLRELRAFAQLHAFAHAMRRQDPSSADVLDALLVAQGVAPSATGDEYGSTETNLRIPNSALTPYMSPIYTVLTLANQAAVCTTSSGAGSPNKLHNHRFLRFDAPAAGRYRIMVASIPGFSTDPDLSGLVDGRRTVIDNAVGPVDVNIDLPAGASVFSLSDFNVLRGATSAGCMVVLIVVAP